MPGEVAVNQAGEGCLRGGWWHTGPQQPVPALVLWAEKAGVWVRPRTGCSDAPVGIGVTLCAGDLAAASPQPAPAFHRALGFANRPPALWLPLGRQVWERGGAMPLLPPLPSTLPSVGGCTGDCGCGKGVSLSL